MAEDNITTNENPFAPPQPEKKPGNSFAIVGYNMLALVLYTLFTRIAGDAGFVLDAFLLAGHFFACIILSIVVGGGMKTGMWLLSAVLVLIIGISSCVYIPPFGS